MFYKSEMLKCSDPTRPQVYPLGKRSPPGPQALKYPPQLQLWPQGDEDGDDYGHDDDDEVHVLRMSQIPREKNLSHDWFKSYDNVKWWIINKWIFSSGGIPLGRVLRWDQVMDNSFFSQN